MSSLEANLEYRQSWRAKLFVLSPDGQWTDMGTGQVYLDGSNIKLENEERPDDILLDHVISNEVYRKQGETILTWSDTSYTNYSLSFQNSEYLQEAWKDIAVIQGKDVSELVNFSDEESEDEERQLPAPTIENISTLKEIFLGANNKESLANAVLATDFLPQLSSLFEQIESEKKQHLLPNFHFIYKVLLSCCSGPVMDCLLSDECYLAFFGGLELDPDVTLPDFKPRDFFTDQATFRNILEIKEEDFLRKIHKTYRFTYLKDSTFTKILDDNTVNYFPTYHMMNLTEIVFQYTNSHSIRQNLVQKLRAEIFDAYVWLNELCMLGKQCAMPTRYRFYETLSEDGVLEILEKSVNNKNFEKEQLERLNVYLSEIIMGMTQIVPNLVKEHFLSKHEESMNYPLLRLVCDSICDTNDIGLCMQMSELIRVLIESDSEEKNFELCDVFYDQILSSFLDRLQIDANVEDVRFTLCEVLNIMAQCVKNHSARIRYFIIYNDAMQKVLQLLDLNDAHLNLSVTQFFRAIVERNDLQFNKFLISNNFFERIFEMYLANDAKDNMIYSSFLALIAVLKNADMELVKHIVDKNTRFFGPSTLRKHFQQLVDRTRSFVEMEIPSDEDDVLGAKRDDPEAPSPTGDKHANINQ